MPRTIEFTITSEYDGMKLLRFLRGQAKLSSSLVNTLKQYDDGIMRDGIKIRTIDKVKMGETIRITIPDDKNEIEPIEYPLDILYEDDDLLVINKPPTLAMHPTHNHQGDTLANAVAWYLNSRGKNSSFRAIGRLDKGTSGIVVCALNRYSAARLSGKIKKVYIAIVNGIFEGEGTIDTPIYRPNPKRTLRACGGGEVGETAVTHWRSVKTGAEKSMLIINLETGRTHQIRVHFASLGSPLVGDTMYGEENDKIGHQLLHCYKAVFTHPVTNKEIILTAKAPDDFLNVKL